ncbi:hypothetical protein EMCRGX_G014854 [Ephydatia muelleri]
MPYKQADATMPYEPADAIRCLTSRLMPRCMSRMMIWAMVQYKLAEDAGYGALRAGRLMIRAMMPYEQVSDVDVDGAFEDLASSPFIQACCSSLNGASDDGFYSATTFSLIHGSNKT